MLKYTLINNIYFQAQGGEIPPPPIFGGNFWGFIFQPIPKRLCPQIIYWQGLKLTRRLTFCGRCWKHWIVIVISKLIFNPFVFFFSNEQIIWFLDKNFKHGVNQSKTVKRMITWVKIKIELIDNQLLTNVFDDVREKMVSTHYTVTSNFLTVRDEYSENSIFQSSQSMFAGFI